MVASNDGTNAKLHVCNANNLDEYNAKGTQITHTGYERFSEEVDLAKGADGKWRVPAIFNTVNGPYCAT